MRNDYHILWTSCPGALAKGGETIDDYNMRLKNTLLRITKLHDVSNVKRDQIVLIVAHASTVDLAAGHLARSRASTTEDLDECFKKIPTGSVLVLEKVQGRRGWTPNLYAIPKMTYSDQSTMFDTEFVLREPIAAKK
ncbi:hypothetical protein OESDEN_01947 [Oesophagostomum dentatum]|uniref:Phosphoglycerate mutase family protein n=1 Tax=Oesophagostomum dentatum TaxID=61180 RepID=A0A0B1TKK0_OESDE|nr:hypothetical protein OESDEN_01947 [Oesophagostomum dentatum]